MGKHILWRRLGRDLLTRSRRALATSAILAAGIAIYVGPNSAIASLFASRDHYYSEANLADVEVRFIPEDAANIPRFDDIAAVAASERRLLLPGTLEWKAQRVPAHVIALDVAARHGINRLVVTDGQTLDSRSPNEVVVESGFAKLRGVQVGDHLKLDVGNDSYKDLRVRGLVRSSEHLIPAASPHLFLPDKGSSAVLFAPIELLAQRLGFRMNNSLLFDLQPGSDTDVVLEAIRRRAEEKLSVEETITQSQQFSTLFLNVDLDAFATYMPSIVAIFGVTAVVIIVFLMSQWITGQRREIGVLMALGYRRRRLATAYLLPVLAIGGVAALLSVPLSYLTLIAFGNSYVEAIGMAPAQLELDPVLAVVGVIVGFCAAIGASLWAQARLFSMTPQDAVRAERTKKRPLGAVKLGGLRTWLWLRYALRNLLRSKVITAFTVGSVGLSLGVSIAYFISMHSFQETLERRVTMTAWDLAVDFSAAVWKDELGPFDELAGIERIDPFLQGAIRIRKDGRLASSVLTGIDPKSSLRAVPLIEGTKFGAQDENVIMLEGQLAKRLGVSVDDRIVVEALGKEYPTRVSAIFSGTMPSEAHAPMQTAQRWLDMEDQATGLLLAVNGQRPAEQLTADLEQLPRVMQVSERRDVISKLMTMIEQIMAILYVAEAFSIGVALLFVFASTSFLVTERTPEYATLRILGFRTGFIRRTIVAEVLLIAILAVILAVPFGYALAQYLTKQAGEAWFTVETIAAPSDFLLIIVPALVVLPLAVYPAMRRVEATSLTKALRERSFG